MADDSITRSPFNAHAESRAGVLERLMQPGVNRGDNFEFHGIVDNGKVKIHYLTVPMKIQGVKKM